MRVRVIFDFRTETARLQRRYWYGWKTLLEAHDLSKLRSKMTDLIGPYWELRCQRRVEEYEG